MSIRLKLTFFYSAILAGTLLVLGGALYASMDRFMASQVDDALSRQAQVVLNNSRGLIDRSRQEVRLDVPADAFAVSGMFVQVIDLQGGVIQRSENLAANEINLPVSDEALNKIGAGEEHYEDITLLGKSMRLYSLPFSVRGSNNPVAVIQIGTLLSDQKEALAILQKLLLTGGGLSLLIAFGIGWLMAGVALSRIGRIADTAEEIAQSGDLTRRVDYVGPSDEVGRLAQTFNAMLEQVQAATARLEEALRQQRRFVADASHELRTPLTSIRSNVGLLRRISHITPEDQAAALVDIDDEAARMSRLISDLLALARADAGRHRAHEPVALRPLLLEVGRQAQVLSNDVQLLVGPIDDATVSGDADRLKQLLLILLDNAFKFTPASGRVELRLTVEAEQQASIVVSDTGVGIAPAALPHIFDRFYRADAARSGSGSGLGLAIAQTIVHEHGGTIAVQSAQGVGSTFTVRLPLIPVALLPTLSLDADQLARPHASMPQL